MLIVRLKQLECAMADGRLDEAFELSWSDRLRSDRRGQELVGRLARALVERGRLHAEAGRGAEASADCDKAAGLAGNTPEVAELRDHVGRLREAEVRASADERNARHRSEQALAAARVYAGRGQLTLCEGVLADAAGDARAEAMKRDLEARRTALACAASAAAAAFAAGDWEAAVDRIVAARPAPGVQPAGALGELPAQVSRHVRDLVRRAVEAGRLDQAAGFLGKLDRLGLPSVETEELRRTLLQCRSALDLALGSEPRRAAATLRLLAPAWPGAEWMATAVRQLEQLGTLSEEIRSGPLGLSALAPVPAAPPAGGNLDETQPHPARPIQVANMEPPAYRRPAIPPPLPKQARADAAAAWQTDGAFLLQVDGVGSFPVVCRPVVTIGPEGGGPSAPDVPVLADPATPRVTVARSDGDYFLRSAAPVLVNDRPTTSTLLNDGDKIALSSRCRLTFRRPNAASGTAALDLSGARLRRGDVRRVLLADRDLLIGPGPHAHVRSDDLTAAAVLQPAGGGANTMLIRAADPVQVDGKPAGKPARVSPGQHVRVGTVSFICLPLP